MAIFRVNKDANYTTISNYHLRDKRLSLKAKGLLTVMLSLPDDWDYSAAGLVAICKEGESSVKAALKELKRYGYLSIEKLNPNETESGQYEYVYNVYEQPEENLSNDYQEGDFLPLENQALENQEVENHCQLNTNKQSTNELNTKEQKRARFQKPTIEQLNEYASEMNYSNFNANQFYDHYESNGWKVGRNPMKDWRAAVRNWVSRDQDTKREQSTPPKTRRQCTECGGTLFYSAQLGVYECGSCFQKYSKNFEIIL